MEIVVCDDEGNQRDRAYELDPYSGLSYAIAHYEPECVCPIATYGEPFPWLYDSRESAAAIWNHRYEPACPDYEEES